MLKLILRWILRGLYGLRAYNEPALSTPGPVLLLCNHLSWWDWLFLGVCLENDWRFATSSATAQLTWLHRRIMINRRTFAVDMNSPYAVKHIAAYLHQGGRLVLFPEGRMSTTGSLMKLFEGTGFLVGKTHAKIITAFLRGAGRLPFSRNPNGKQWFPRVSVHFSQVLIPPRAAHGASMEARLEVTNWLRDQMLRQQFETEMEFGPRTLDEALATTARKVRGRAAVQDVSLKELSYGRLLTGACVLSRHWRGRLTPDTERVGVLLPNVNAFPVVLLSLWFRGCVPAILNYTAGPASLLSCAQLAGLKQVITSRRFLERSQLDVTPLQAAGIELVFLEDSRTRISFVDQLRGALRARFGRPGSSRPARPEETALVLFTSGSEGEPKGVELSHRNVLANVRQMLAMIDLQDQDRLFNALPLFHSFGLTVGLLLPLLQGNFVFLYLSPLHYRGVPAALYNTNATIFFGTNTFLSAYARKAHPYDFRTVRYVFAGAEKLLETTCTVWMQKFGVRLLEGYGATECSPCLSVNVPMQSRPWSAGRFLPGVEYRFEPVEGLDAGLGVGSSTGGTTTAAAGRLFVRGPNVMRGYLNPSANAVFQSGAGWYDTGDIARVDADGFVFLLGRLKRFAKVSGEMISLGAVEEALATAFGRFGPRFAIAVLAKPDDAKGERLIAVTNERSLTLAQVREAIRERGLSNLAAPRDLRFIAQLPLLGTGKVNHRELDRILDNSPAKPADPV